MEILTNMAYAESFPVYRLSALFDVITINIMVHTSNLLNYIHISSQAEYFQGVMKLSTNYDCMPHYYYLS